MGVENNECVIATTFCDENVSEAKEWLKNVPKEQQKLFVFVPAIANGKTTIILAPDGSKKGWSIADETERVRNKFVEFLKGYEYEDGSSSFDWIEVGYGEFGQKILRGNCRNMYNDSDYAV